MPAFIDRTGQRHGRLVVLQRAPNTKWGKTRWKCRCDCGKYTIRNSRSLLRIVTNSCGCYVFRLPKGEAAFNQVYCNYRHDAKKRKHTFCLSKEDFRNVIEQNCFYCGIEPKQIGRATSDSGEYIYNGIDRVDSSKGYELDNVVPCCKTCNQMKWAQTQKAFFAHVTKIQAHTSKRNKRKRPI